MFYCFNYKWPTLFITACSDVWIETNGFYAFYNCINGTVCKIWGDLLAEVQYLHFHQCVIT